MILCSGHSRVRIVASSCFGTKQLFDTHHTQMGPSDSFNKDRLLRVALSSGSRYHSEGRRAPV